MIQEILKAISLLFETFCIGAKAAGENAKPYAKLYIKGLLLLVVIAILFPIPFLIIDIIGDLKWLTPLAGLWYAFWVFLLLVFASPIGILIESLTGGIKGSVQQYIKWVSGVLVAGLSIALFVSILPIKANIAMLPLVIVAAIILGILNVWFFSRKVITPIVSIIFFLLILSFIFPTTFETIGGKISDIDISTGEPERLFITYESIEKQEIKFFRPDGKAKVWYYRTGDGRFELFNKKGHHPIYKEKLKPVTSEAVFQIKEQLKVEEERRMQEEQRKREEAKKLEEQRKAEEDRKREESLKLEQKKREEALKLEQQKQEEALKIEQQRQEEAKRQEEQRLAQEHEAFLNLYLTTRSFTNNPESPEVAVLVIDEDNTISQDITRKIALLLKNERLNVTSSLFTGAFVSDGIFEKIFGGDAGKVKNLELSKYSDHVILGKKRVNFTENPDLQNMITAKASIEIHVTSSETGAIEDSFTIEETGAGFSKSIAEGVAMERILTIISQKLSETFNKGGIGK